MASRHFPAKGEFFIKKLPQEPRENLFSQKTLADRIARLQGSLAIKKQPSNLKKWTIHAGSEWTNGDFFCLLLARGELFLERKQVVQKDFSLVGVWGENPQKKKKCLVQCHI